MSRFDALPLSPFTRLNTQLEGIPPGLPPINMHVGEPQHAVPHFVGEILARHTADFGRYPPIIGPEPLRKSIAAWLTRRYQLGTSIDPERHILPLVGTREGLFSAAFVTIPEEKRGRKPVVLIPNPFYQCYAAAALCAGAEPVYVNATRESNFIPDFASLSPDILARTAAVYMCSPSNPEGAACDAQNWQRLFELADEFDFIVLADECYSEIYTTTAPAGSLSARKNSAGDFKNLLAFHSLSKRSNLAGLRSGFVAGDDKLIARLREFRNVTGPQLPLPIAAVSTAAWSDEIHVEENRALYAAKFGLTKNKLSNRFGFRVPDGGFFLWLDVGDGVSAATRLWQEGGIKVLPGEYLARNIADGNPGKPFIRVALVNDFATTSEALDRLARIL
ncbi:MAG: aminotransferase class I/II-fold pyridoxal phosphate-dependent enzyme [Alphaproteobacteria bacterium]|nr:aminotransferase class I/II-fold pyridoxal phosphate-dependent enzyme [Alphaproteobacteria bacterium]